MAQSSHKVAKQILSGQIGCDLQKLNNTFIFKSIQILYCLAVLVLKFDHFVSLLLAEPAALYFMMLYYKYSSGTHFSNFEIDAYIYRKWKFWKIFFFIGNDIIEHFHLSDLALNRPKKIPIF